MTDKELFDKIIKDREFEKSAADVVNEQINAELAKKSPDYDLVAELTKQYTELIGADEEIAARSEEHCNEIVAAATEKYKPSKRFFRQFAVIAASVAVIMISANCVTVAALNMNIFKAIVHYASGGFSVDFTTAPVDENPDPYGIRAECTKYGISPEVPTYLPDGFEIFEINHERLENKETIDFLYHKGDTSIGIYYNVFDDPDDMSSVKYPSDYFNISEIEINGSTAIVSKEDDQLTLVYGKDNILMTIFTVDVPYAECDKIIESIR